MDKRAAPDPAAPKGLCYVSYISNDVIKLGGADRRWRAFLRAHGVAASWWLDGVAYPDSDPHAEELCARLLIRLARLGVAFAEDYKQGLAPADLMRDLQARRILCEPFDAVSWNGSGGYQRVRQLPPA